MTADAGTNRSYRHTAPCDRKRLVRVCGAYFLFQAAGIRHQKGKIHRERIQVRQHDSSRASCKILAALPQRRHWQEPSFRSTFTRKKAIPFSWRQWWAAAAAGAGAPLRNERLATKAGLTKLVAMADVFPDKLKNSYEGVKAQFDKQVEVPDERKFIGFDGYKKAMDALRPGDVVVPDHPSGISLGSVRLCD